MKSSRIFLIRVRRVLRLDGLSPATRRVVVGVTGGTVLVVGLAMIVLPGPAFLVIPAGLAILATEFAWARYYLIKARQMVRKARGSSKKDAVV